MTEEQGKPSAVESRSHALLDVSDELSRMIDLLNLLMMASGELSRPDSSAFSQGISMTRDMAQDVDRRVRAIRAGSTQGS